MSLLEIGSQVFKWAPPETRKKLRRIGMRVATWKPRVAREVQALASGSEFNEAERFILGNVDKRISVGDSMYTGDVQDYFKIGLGAIKAIEKVGDLALDILDFPCGWGRVTRYLQCRYPYANITACDIEAEGVDFCAKTFGTIKAYSKSNFDEITLDLTYDLIFCGSLVTHLRSGDIQKLFQFFDRHLNAGGVVLFSAHGEHVAQTLQDTFPWMTADICIAPLYEYRASGCTFIRYPSSKSMHDKNQYGFSITSREWIKSHCPWEEIYFEPHGWSGFQDWHAYRKP